jgi:hypothetical protein
MVGCEMLDSRSSVNYVRARLRESGRALTAHLLLAAFARVMWIRFHCTGYGYKEKGQRLIRTGYDVIIWKTAWID